MPHSQRLIKAIRITVLTALCACVLLSAGKWMYDTRIVATMDGGTVYYQGMTYGEVFDGVDMKSGRCLGTLLRPDQSKCRIYEVNGHPDCLFVSLLIDHQIYRLKS